MSSDGVHHWTFTDGSRTRETLDNFGTVLGRGLPGPPPTLAFFLDHTEFREPLRQMRAAWQAGNPEELGTSPTQVEAFFASPAHAGRTVIVVSHVTNGHMALGYGAHSPRMPIADVEAAARRHGVLLVLIGCQTAGVAVGSGFSGNINTDNVEYFLRELPSAPTVRQLFGGMAAIGPLVIDAPGFTEKVAAVAGHRGVGDTFAEVVLPKNYWDPPVAAPPPTLQEPSTEPLESWWDAPLTSPGAVDPDAWRRPYSLVLPGLTVLSWLVELCAAEGARSPWFLQRRERLRWLVRLLHVRVGARAVRWVGLLGFIPVGLWLDFEDFVLLIIPACIGYHGLANWGMEWLGQWKERKWPQSR